MGDWRPALPRGAGRAILWVGFILPEVFDAH